MPFTGFTEKTIKFLFEIGYNNSREWYEEHKPDYKKDVLRPFQDLVADLGEKMKNIDPEFELRPAVDKTISRIYRDTRFSKDKTPYRNNVWISFKKAVPDWKETPVYFFEIFPEYYHFGMGFFNYPSNLKEKLRESILENPATFKKAVSFYGKKSTAAQFEIAGETFKRVKDKDVPEDLRKWYERKGFYLYCRRDLDDLVFGPGLVDFLYKNFLTIKPLYVYLWEVIRQPKLT